MLARIELLVSPRSRWWLLRRARLVAVQVALAIAVLLASFAASAGGRPVLFYDAPAECPSATAVAEEGEARGITRWLDRDGRPFTLRIERGAGTFVASLDLGRGAAPRVFRAARCEEVVSATVLALALAVRDEATEEREATASSEGDPSPEPPVVAPFRALEASPSGPLLGEREVAAALPSRASERGLRVDAAALMVTGVSAGGSYGVQAGAAWAWRRWEVRGGARFVRLGVRPEEVGALVAAPLDLCLRRAHEAFEVAACARMEVGASANPDRSVAPWLSPGVVGRLRFGERAAFFGVDVELGAPLVHSATIPVAEGPTLAIAVGMGVRL